MATRENLYETTCHVEPDGETVIVQGIAFTRKRTCRIEEENYDELLELWRTRLTCGHSIINAFKWDYAYCPDCGAKVVE